MEQATFSERVERIKAERKAKQLSCGQLASRAGLPPSTIQEMDKPGWNPTLRTLIAVEKALLSEDERAA